MNLTLEVIGPYSAQMGTASRKVFGPGASPSLAQQFRQLKSVDFKFTSEPQYELNTRSGHATVVIGAKREFVTKVGGKQKPDEDGAAFKLHRPEPDSDEWTIDDVRHHK